MANFMKYLTENLLMTFLRVGVIDVIPRRGMLKGIQSSLNGQPSTTSCLFSVLI